MEKKPNLNSESFKDLLKDAEIKTIKQDKHFFKRCPTHEKSKIKPPKEQLEVSLSDDYHPLLPEEGSMRYHRDGSTHQLKQLRRGDFEPEATIDLHGLTQTQAKRMLIEDLAQAKQQSLTCICITHGHGKGILKQQVPRWLAQHPHVVAFHVAPKHLGGHATLLVLLDTLYNPDHKETTQD
tara:strand:- start:4324 stop:4866 length:543 start_codon:yes stop_codon:yes gene_type:complete